MKFKDEIDLSIKYNRQGLGKIGVDINEILSISSTVDSSYVMFNEKSVKQSIARKEDQEMRFKIRTSSVNGISNDTFLDDEPEIITFKNTLRLKFNSNPNIEELIKEIKQNPDIEYVEPNYLFSINDYNIESDVIYEENLKPTISNSVSNTPADPLYSQQVGIGQTNVDKVWEEYTTGDGSQIVAVLDTGIDYTHPDLEDNIWINEAELNGVEGFDDDGNGYVDDIRGWDFHHKTNTPLDDNMHGTHVAGIIGAVANNEKGIAGVVWNVKLMPIKVLQASGIGDVATIALGVDYATNNGATVINMSFGGTINSITLKNALANAYAGSKRFLVAAAGNNGLPLPPCFPSQTFYPAAYGFVFGVETNAKFSNFDCDGPIFSVNAGLTNYETDAPGVAVMSTVPKGGYRALSGTSMAAPFVSGIVALYNETRDEFETNERKFGNLINTKGDTFIDALAAIKAEPKPILKLVGREVVDSLSTNKYQDGQLDSGEEIHLYPTVKNYWGTAENVKVKLKLAGNEFSNEYYKGLIDIQDSIINLGTISDYALYKQRENPLKFKISEEAVHNTQIEFRMLVWQANQADPDNPYASERDVDSIDFRNMIKNAVKLQGLVEKDTTLYADKEYYVTNNFIINNATLTIKPGVTINFGNNEEVADANTQGQIKFIGNKNRVIAEGTKDSLITFKPDTYRNNFSYEDPNVSWNNYSTPDSLKGSRYSWFKLDRGNFYTREWTVVENAIVFDGSLRGDGSIRYSNYIHSNRWRVEDPLRKGCSNCFIDENGNIIKYRYDNWYDEDGDGTYTPRDTSIVDIDNYDSFFNNFIEVLENDHYNLTAERIYGTEGGENWHNLFYSGITDEITKEPYPGAGYKVRDPNAGYKMYGFRVPGSGAVEFEGVYMGTGNIDIMKDMNFDAFDGADGLWKYNNPRTTPYSQAHAIVWKVEVNGKNAFDDFDEMDPLGVGSHEFKVYFSKPVDTDYPPNIAYGVREPWNSIMIDEQGTWSDDGSIYTVTHDINIGSSDGINTISVWGAKELYEDGGWDVPIEQRRFKMYIQSSGSASTGFAATPGLGEITLDWDAPREEDLADVLGYNMYRYEAVTDSTFSDPVKINESLITEIKYEDFNVERLKQYFYKYKILRTNLTETDYSTTVTAELLTADLGDSNGDSSVNVLDVVNTVDYILGNNPTPFIDYATDVNDDSNINVLDVVGIVDLVLKGNSARPGNGSGFRTSSSNGVDYYPNSPVGKAVFYWEGNDLYVESEYNIGGMQLVFDKDFKYILSDELSKFEHIDFDQDNQKVFMFYSFNGVETQKKTKLLTRLKEDVSLDIDKAVIGTPNGLKLEANFEEKILPDLDAPEQGDQLKILSVSPNTSNGRIRVRYYLPEKMDKMVVRLYNTIGQLIWSSDDLNNNSGQSEKSFVLNPVSKGVYIFTMDALKSGEIKNRTYKRLIVE